MKKKILVIFVLLTVAVLLFSACKSPSAKYLQKINDMLNADYSEITVLINTKTANVELEGNFTLTFATDGSTTIYYRFDHLNTFDDEGNVTGPSNDFIVEERGTVVVRNGVIVEGDASVNLPDELNISGFNFKQAFFKNASSKNAKFEADVIDPQNFTGYFKLVCSNMHIVVISNTNTNSLNRIDLSYTSDKGAEVTINYLFTK